MEEGLTIRMILAGTALALAASLAQAQDAPPPPSLDDAASLRSHAMKNAGLAAGLGGKMLKGEAPFDARVAQAALAAINSTALGIGLMVPEGSGGEKTQASDKIWSDKAGFEAAVAKFIADSSAAVAAKVADMDGFKAQFVAVTSNCKACHEKYRVKRN